MKRFPTSVCLHARCKNYSFAAKFARDGALKASKSRDARSHFQYGHFFFIYRRTLSRTCASAHCGIIFRPAPCYSSRGKGQRGDSLSAREGLPGIIKSGQIREAVQLLRVSTRRIEREREREREEGAERC